MNRRLPVYIHAAAALGPRGDSSAGERAVLSADPPPFDYRELVRKVVGAPLRQASHLIELAAIGSQLCLKRLPVAAPEDTAVYLGTGLAEVRKTHSLFYQVMPPGPGMASPFDFINAANNMAAFYCAKLGNFRARNLTITQDRFSFEWALKLALGDLGSGSFRHALVGGVDENSQPRLNHLRRIQLRDDQLMGEGAGFLYLSVERAGARGELLEVRRLPPAADPAQAVAAGLRAWRENHEPVVLLPGYGLEETDSAALQSAGAGLEIRNYLAWCGCFHTAAAFGLAALLDPAPPANTLIVHLNRDASGQLLLVALRAYPG